MNPFKVFHTPEYLFRPTQILTRIKRSFVRPSGEKFLVRLPWGDDIRVRPAECIGCGIWYYGIFDLIVAEALARLTDEGEHALDIGANIGQMTSLFNYLVGPGGRVDSFEPHPQVFSDLSDNASIWEKRYSGKVMHLHPIALGDKNEMGCMVMPESWQTNMGIGRVDVPVAGEVARDSLSIEIKRLDGLLDGDAKIGVCKIDIEGNELQAFQGASRLLQNKQIRDIIFEDLDIRNGSVCKYLESFDYQIFFLWSKTMRPMLDRNINDQQGRVSDGKNYLATLDPDRAMRRFHQGGWKVLKGW